MKKSIHYLQTTGPDRVLYSLLERELSQCCEKGSEVLLIFSKRLSPAAATVNWEDSRQELRELCGIRAFPVILGSYKVREFRDISQ